MKNEKKKVLEMFNEQTLLAAYRGSISHGTFIPSNQPNSSDDVDLIGIYMAPVPEYLGLKKVKEHKDSFVDQYDLIEYEFKKMVEMLLKGNPNVISLLWLNEEHYLKMNLYGRALLDFREWFISDRIYRTHVRYAEGELKRLDKPEFKGYMGQKRKKLRDKYGYDIRHASHCIRLLRMGLEFAETGRLNVYRTKDAHELIDIKKGKWTLKEVQDEALRLFSLAEVAYNKCELPPEPQTEKVYKLVEEIMFDYIRANYRR